MDHQPSWSIDGEACFVSLTRTLCDAESEAITEWVDAIAEATTSRSAATLKLGTLDLKGVRLDDAEAPDLRSRSLVFAFRADGAVWFLHVYDSLDEQGRMSDELRPLLEMVRETFRLR